VTVHGTAFAVDVVPAAQGTAGTRVRVSSGVVSVAAGGHEVYLTAGMEWSSAAPETASRGSLAEQPKEAPVAAAVAQTQAAGGTRTPPPHRGHAQAHSPARDDSASASTLGEENRLLASAIAAAKGGNYGDAVDTLDDLLRRFPTSPVAPEAHVQRFRILEQSGNVAAAAREARTYLALYPEGSAREEAKRLAVEP
jgi:TolA-binding protein